MKESENYDIFSAKDRSEFLFKVFTHITLGGPVNQVRVSREECCKSGLLTRQTCFQYEDEVKLYLSTAKLLYKTLLT